jgi:hypothetical protein
VNTPELERRLTVVLQRHAEDAMRQTNTQEEFETLEVGMERGSRHRRRIFAGVALVAAAAAAIAVIVSVQSIGSDRPGTTPPAQAPSAVDTATAFVQAYGSYDRDRTATYLADDGVLDSLRTEYRWFEAVGFTLLLDSCEEQATLIDGTAVSCTFDYHALHSEEMGKGPYSGNVFRLTIQDGKVVRVDQELEFEGNGFSKQMWEPFAAWVARVHPKDAAVMYTDWPGQTTEALNPRSIALWKQHSSEYVDAKADRTG